MGRGGFVGRKLSLLIILKEKKIIVQSFRLYIQKKIKLLKRVENLPGSDSFLIFDIF